MFDQIRRRCLRGYCKTKNAYRPAYIVIYTIRYIVMGSTLNTKQYFGYLHLKMSSTSPIQITNVAGNHEERAYKCWNIWTQKVYTSATLKIYTGYKIWLCIFVVTFQVVLYSHQVYNWEYRVNPEVGKCPTPVSY